jgi:hypothetical protein
MSTPQFLDWLDSKMKEYWGKLVPPEDVLLNQLAQSVRTNLEKRITDEVLKEANTDARVDEEFDKCEPMLLSRLESLEQEVRNDLEDHPEHHWAQPISEIAESVTETVLPAPLSGEWDW